MIPINAAAADKDEPPLQTATMGAAVVRLMMILFSMIATTLMGIGVIVVLSMGMGTEKPIIAAAAAGFVLAIPVSWFAAKQMIGKFSA